MHIPFAFKLLIQELNSMNINVTLKCELENHEPFTKSEQKEEKVRTFWVIIMSLNSTSMCDKELEL